MGTDGERPRKKPLRVDGHTFWRASRGGGAVDLVAETGIELGESGCRWTVSVPGSSGSGIPVESASHEVRRFMGGVFGAMERVTRRATVRPVPKPVPKPAAPLPATAPVPCPLCLGEAWPDCELCDGSGAVTQRRAEEWRELHGR